MFTKNKFITLLICSVLTCGLFCGSFLLTQVNAQTPPTPPGFNDEITDTIEPETPTPPPTTDIDTPSDTETDTSEDESTPQTNYLTSEKTYRNGFNAYKGAVKYLELCDSYQINSSGSLTATILGQSLDGTLAYNTIYKDKLYNNLFSINCSLANVNIQATSNESKIRLRSNTRTDLKEFTKWKDHEITPELKMFNRKIVIGDISEDNSSISGFRKTNDGYTFVVNLTNTDLFTSLAYVIKNIGGSDIGLHFEHGSITYKLNKYGAPVTASYNMYGKVSVLGVTVPASVYFLERYGNYNKNIEIDPELFGNSKFYTELPKE